MNLCTIINTKRPQGGAVQVKNKKDKNKKGGGFKIYCDVHLEMQRAKKKKKKKSFIMTVWYEKQIMKNPFRFFVITFHSKCKTTIQ